MNQIKEKRMMLNCLLTPIFVKQLFVQLFFFKSSMQDAVLPSMVLLIFRDQNTLLCREKVCKLPTRLPTTTPRNLPFTEPKGDCYQVFLILKTTWPFPSALRFLDPLVDFNLTSNRGFKHTKLKNQEMWRLDRGKPLSLQKESLRVQHYSFV